MLRHELTVAVDTRSFIDEASRIPHTRSRAGVDEVSIQLLFVILKLLNNELTIRLQNQDPSTRLTLSVVMHCYCSIIRHFGYVSTWVPSKQLEQQDLER